MIDKMYKRIEDVLKKVGDREIAGFIIVVCTQNGHGSGFVGDERALLWGLEMTKFQLLAQTKLAPTDEHNIRVS